MVRLFGKGASVGLAAALTISAMAVSHAAPHSDEGLQLDAVEQPLAATASVQELQELAEQHPMLAPGHGDPDALRGDFDGDGVADTAVAGVDAGTAAGDGVLLCWVEFALSSQDGKAVRQNVEVTGFTGNFLWSICPKTTVVDFDGDGTDEVFMYHDDEPGWGPLRGRVAPLTVSPDTIREYPLSEEVGLSDGTTFVYRRLHFGDVNDDGRTDVVAVNSSPAAAHRLFDVWLTPESGAPDWRDAHTYNGRFEAIADVDPSRPGNEIVFHPIEYTLTGEPRQRVQCTVDALYVPSGDRRVIAMPPADQLCPTDIKAEPVTAGDVVSGVAVTWLNPSDPEVSPVPGAYRADSSGVFREVADLPALQAWDDHVVLFAGKYTMGCIPVELNDPQTFGATIIITKTPEKGFARVTSRGGTPCVFYEWTHAGNGADSFEYKLVGPGKESKTARVTIENSGELPPAPVAHDDTFLVDLADGPLTCLPIVNNDENARYASVKVIGGPTQGAVRRKSFAEGLTCLVYEAKTVGTDTLTYVLENSGRRSEPATVTVNVSGAPKPPVAVADDQVWPYTAAAPDCVPVLGNDANTANGEVTISVAPRFGVAAYDELRGCMMYKAHSIATTADKYTYQVETAGGVAQAVVTIIRPGGLPAVPVAVDDEFTVPFGAVQTLCVADNDEKTGPVEVTVTRQPESGSVKAAFERECVQFTAPEAAESPAVVTFEYTAINAAGMASPAVVTVTLTEPAPVGELVARNDWVELTYGGNEGGCVPVLRNDAGVQDAQGKPLPGARVELVDVPTVGRATVSANNCVVYWRASTAVGDEEFTYRVVLEDGTVSNTARLRVTMKGNPPEAQAPKFE